MKKLIFALLTGLLVLTGCGSEAVEYVGVSDMTLESEIDAGDYGTVEAKLTLTQEGDIIGAEFDIVDTDGVSRKEAEAAGDFSMNTDVSWTEQVASLEEYVVANDAMPILDADGKDVDGATTATIDLTFYQEAFDAAIATKDTSAEYYMVTYTKEGDDITNTSFDVVSADGTYSKIADAEAGNYDMKTEVSYQDQVADLGRYVDENDAFPAVDGDGPTAKATDGQTTATIKIGSYKQAFDNAQEA